jgi:hypothetical protein
MDTTNTATTATTTTATTGPVRIAAYHAVTKRLGHWTTARDFEVRAHRGNAVLDLRSPRIPEGDIRLRVDLDHAVLKVLVADDAVIDDWGLRRVGRGRVKDAEAPRVSTGRRIAVTGAMRHGEIRVHRGGIAVLSAMFSREFLVEARRAHREGRRPSVADPANAA